MGIRSVQVAATQNLFDSCADSPTLDALSILLLDERISDDTLDPSMTSTSIDNACESIDVDLESAST